MENNFVKKDNNRQIFYGIIAISTFIIMAVGATFAYFTANASSAGSSLSTRSAALQLEYISYESAWQKLDLIPANTNIVEYSVEYQNDTTAKKTCYNEGNEVVDCEDGSVDASKTTYSKNNTVCVDDDGNSICSIYEFQIKNSTNSKQELSIDISSVTNEFTGLNAMGYELSAGSNEEYNSKENNNSTNDPVFKTNSSTEGIGVLNGKGEEVYTETPIYVNRKGAVRKMLQYTDPNPTDEGVTIRKPAIDRLLANSELENEEDRVVRLADKIEISANETKTFIIVLYIKNENYDQTDVDANKNFSGSVIVSTGDGAASISGKISAAGTTEGGLQSGLQ